MVWNGTREMVDLIDNSAQLEKGLPNSLQNLLSLTHHVSWIAHVFCLLIGWYWPSTSSGHFLKFGTTVIHIVIGYRPLDKDPIQMTTLYSSVIDPLNHYMQRPSRSNSLLLERGYKWQDGIVIWLLSSPLPQGSSSACQVSFNPLLQW